MELNDNARASAWHSDDDIPARRFPPRWKGKGREIDGDYTDVVSETGYPPAEDDERESRRITSNLRTWDAKERHKRKQTRDATVNHAAGQSQSVIDGVGRRASSLWNTFGGRHKSKRPSGSDHQVLQDAELQGEQEIQLSTFEPGSLVTDTPTATPTQREFSNDSRTQSGNPFADPDENSVIIARSRQDSIMPNDAVIMDPVPTPPADNANNLASQLSDTSSHFTYRTRQPGPQPISLPPPKTPPPQSDSNTSILTTPELSYDEDQPGKGKWWTEWLCGCSEGPDRGGDNQAGRTNPYE